VSDINARLVEIELEMNAHAAAMPKLPAMAPANTTGPELAAAPATKVAPERRETGSNATPRTEGKRRTLRY
jgi:hypothetical protein